ncbi:MAG TPA: hypothetical protein VGH11_03785 [Jatrophihabitans sp.]|jgi:hypothetical protein
MNDPTRGGLDSDMQEARCERCGETFAISDGITREADDFGGTELLHVRRRQGELCGGIGVPFRRYVIRNPNRI